mgnify:CR=1 FL=1
MTKKEVRTSLSHYAIVDKFRKGSKRSCWKISKSFLTVHLKKFLALEKVIKMKNSFKLATPMKIHTAVAVVGEKKPKRPELFFSK